MEKKIVKKIDIHVHASESGWPAFEAGIAFATPEELIQMYDELGVEMGVLLPELPDSAFVTSSNYEIWRITQKYPDRFTWFCNFEPWQVRNAADLDFTPALQWCKDHGAKGVGEIIANVDFDDPRVLNLMAGCEKVGLPFLFHIGVMGNDYGLVAGERLEKLEKVLQMFPNLKFLGHSQRFWEEISNYEYRDPEYKFNKGKVIPGGRVVELMRKYPNLLGDLSAGSGYHAMTRDPEFTYGFMEEFADRLYYGTDICHNKAMSQPLVKLAAFLDDAMLEGKISYDTYYKISRGNAEKLLGLTK